MLQNQMIKLRLQVLHKLHTISMIHHSSKIHISSYNVRQAVGLAVEQVVLNGVSPEQAIEEAINSLK